MELSSMLHFTKISNLEHNLELNTRQNLKDLENCET